MKGFAVLRDRFVLGVMAMAIVGAGAALLCWPVHLDAHDRWGFEISCGSGLSADDGPAAVAGDDAGGGGGYVERCHSAVQHRRLWAAALVTMGVAGAAAGAWAGRRGTQSPVNDEFDWKTT